MERSLDMNLRMTTTAPRSVDLGRRAPSDKSHPQCSGRFGKALLAARVLTANRSKPPKRCSTALRPRSPSRTRATATMRPSTRERYYSLLTELRFFPNSPTFTGAGTPLGNSRRVSFCRSPTIWDATRAAFFRRCARRR